MTRPREKPLAAPFPSLRPASAVMAGLGVAAPDVQERQSELARQFAALWKLQGEAAKRWDRVIAGSQIETRSAVAPIVEVPRLTTAERMRLYETHAPALAQRAALEALAESGVTASAVTDLIIVTCTGFAAPGVDVELVRGLGLSPTVRRQTIGFMGCFGAITGLRAAFGACAADPEGVTLLVCVELCSLHLRGEPDVQNQIASALFADGAAAVVMTGSDHHHHDSAADRCAPCLALAHPGASMLFDDHRDDMSWRITDAGFAMTLSPRVPTALRRALPAFLASLGSQPGSIAIHPGGAAILDAAAEAVAPRFEADIEDARAIMRAHGNMSSPTVLFVLRRMLQRASATPLALLAFGPGLTIESITLE